MADRPLGVTVVGILTLLGVIGNFFFAMLLAALSCVGGPPSTGYHPSIYFEFIVYSPLLLSLLSCIVSISMFSGARYGWHLSILLWVSSAIYYSFIALFYLPSNLKSVVLGLALLVNAVLIIYFQSKPVKNYFLNPRTK